MRIIELIETKEFERIPKRGKHNPYFEGLYDYGVFDLFEDLKEELGRIPSQTEYLERGLQCAEKFFTDNPTQWCGYKMGQWVFEWDDDLIKSVLNRLDRTYNSFVIEAQVEEFVTETYPVRTPRGPINRHIDTNFGADIALIIQERFYYIHIAKDSERSRWHLKDKGTRKSYIPKDGKKHYWYRNWNKVHHGHHQLLYDESNPQQTEVINGLVVFKETYLKYYFDKLFAGDQYDVYGESEIEMFYRFLVKNNILKEND